jgi:hypothetical protein
MILENDHNQTVGFFKLKCGDLVYLDDMYGYEQISAYMILHIEKLGKKNTCTTYQFYELRTNKIRTVYLNHGLTWIDLQFVIKHDY